VRHRDPLPRRYFRSSAWRSRVWAATVGRFTLEDLRSAGALSRAFLADHEAHVLEAFLWQALARIIPPTPGDEYCFRGHRKMILDRIVRCCFDPEIVEGVFERCVPPAAAQDTVDPFLAFVEYWNSAPVRQAVRCLLGLAPETDRSSTTSTPEALPGAAVVKAEPGTTRREKEAVSTGSRSFSIRRNETFKHPGVDVGYQAYHPLAPSLARSPGPVDYEGEARKIQTRRDSMDTEEEPEGW
jgi:hypothetical protein